jgi:bifunctional DNA-binding transcriptional regulator/antitoxin component of YhaV-PrlF toxin-antitoxin module
MKQLGNSRLTSRCQVTVPRSVRRLMKLTTGDLLVFVASRKEVVLKKGEVRIND